MAPQDKPYQPTRSTASELGATLIKINQLKTGICPVKTKRQRCMESIQQLETEAEALRILNDGDVNEAHRKALEIRQYVWDLEAKCTK